MSTRDREDSMLRSAGDEGSRSLQGNSLQCPGALCSPEALCRRRALQVGRRKRVPYLHGDHPQLLGRQPPHLTRQHLCLVQDGEIGVGHGSQDPACHYAEQPDGWPRGPRPVRAAGTAADQSGRPHGLLFLGLAGHAASGHSPPTGSRRWPWEAQPAKLSGLLRSRLRGAAAVAGKLRGRPAAARARGRPPSPGSGGSETATPTGRAG